jgi:hypothetical protein
MASPGAGAIRCGRNPSSPLTWLLPSLSSSMLTLAKRSDRANAAAAAAAEDGVVAPNNLPVALLPRRSLVALSESSAGERCSDESEWCTAVAAAKEFAVGSLEDENVDEHEEDEDEGGRMTSASSAAAGPMSSSRQSGAKECAPTITDSP